MASAAPDSVEAVTGAQVNLAELVVARPDLVSGSRLIRRGSGHGLLAGEGEELGSRHAGDEEEGEQAGDEEQHRASTPLTVDAADARRGLAQNMGGSGGSCTVHILEVI